MKVTDDMINNACRAYNERAFSNSSPAGIRAALGAALADVPEPVPGPFVLSGDERAAKDGAGTLLATALDRAVRTLGAPTVEPLSDELRADATYIRDNYVDGGVAKRVAAELLRRCPKPEPKQKTAAELISFLRQEVSGRAGVSQALDALAELVAIAEGAAK